MLLLDNRRKLLVLVLALGLAFAVYMLAIRGERPPDREPAVEELPVHHLLPDPFRLDDGTRVRTRAAWKRRREEIKELLLHYQYGRMPPGPGNITARELSSEPSHETGATRRMLVLSMGPDHRVMLYLGLIVPEGRGPFPVILNIDHREAFAATMAEQVARRGYIFAGYDPNHLDPDQPGVTGMAQAAYPEHDWGTIAVWAWGAMRVLDHLYTLDVVDRERVAVTGHSRSGKTALMAGAFDERFALVAPMGSGCGGMGSYRFRGAASETLDQVIRQFEHWFHPRLRQFAGQEERLPFDQHFLSALVAPRAMLSVDALGDLWANPLGTQQTFRGARPVFEFLGVASRQGIVFRPGGHEQTDADWSTLLEFCDWVFAGIEPSNQGRFLSLPFGSADRILNWKAPDL